MRLLCVGGEDAFLLESIFRSEVWDFMNEPVSRTNEEAVNELLATRCLLAPSPLRRSIYRFKPTVEGRFFGDCGRVECCTCQGVVQVRANDRLVVGQKWSAAVLAKSMGLTPEVEAVLSWTAPAWAHCREISSLKARTRPPICLFSYSQVSGGAEGIPRQCRGRRTYSVREDGINRKTAPLCGSSPRGADGVAGTLQSPFEEVRINFLALGA